MARYAYRKTYTWSADLAYIVGLIASDGSLSKDGRHISFTSKDRQLAELYRALIRPSAKLGRKGAGHTSEKPYYLIQFSDTALYDFLMHIGMTANKSLTMPGLAIPSEYFADFLRGEFDGDGCIFGYKDKRWPNSYMHYTSFISASPNFIQWLRITISQQVKGIGVGTMRWTGGSYQLSYAKKDTSLLFGFMYYNEAVPRLIRKYERFLELFALNPYPIRDA